MRFVALGGLLAATTFAAGGTFSACGNTSSKPLGDGAAGTSGDTDGGGTYSAGPVDGKCVSGTYTYDGGGACQCLPALPHVCRNGCTNQDTDNDNCGGCDNKCGPTSTCVAGTCSPAPALVVPAVLGCTKSVGVRDFGLGIAISGPTLYVADAGHGTVTSYPVGGGAATTLAAGERAPHALAVVGATVVWIDSVAGPMGASGRPVVTARLRKAGAAGAAATTLAEGVNDAYGIQGVALSAGGDTAYYSTNTSIMSVPIEGGTPTNVGNEAAGGPPGALALDGMKLAYPTPQNGDVNVITIEAGKVASCGLRDAMGALQQINCMHVGHGGGSLNVSTILARDSRAYFADGANLKASDTGPGATILNAYIIAQSPGGFIRAMAMSADGIYFVLDDIVARTPIVKDSKAQPIARGQKTPASVAVDATKVYWGNDGDCTVASTDL